MIYEGVEFPFWDEEQRAWICQETDEWVVSMVPQLVNDRVCLNSKEEHGRSYTAGYCYDKNYLAMAAASIWDTKTQQRPPLNPKRIAYDSRDMYSLFGYADEQYICGWCWHEMKIPNPPGDPHTTLSEPTLCSGCGSLRDNGGLLELAPQQTARLRFPRGARD